MLNVAAMRTASQLCFSLIVAAANVLSVPKAAAQAVAETVFYDMPGYLMPEDIPAPSAELLAVPGYPDDPARFTLLARLYLPDPNTHGPGPYPVVVFLHGSGGLWPNGNTIPANMTVNNAPASQFRDWGNLLSGMGYACLFPDSLHPRGLTGSFEGRRPHHDPAQDDAACSPNYERPKDVVAALEYLASRADIALERLALIGFSHGAQTGMNALLDVSVDLGNYEVDFVDLVDDGQGGQMEQTVKKAVPGPVRIPAHLPVPKFCAFYYGGGGHFSYHGQPSSTAAGRYMMDRRTTAILFHGTGDSLLGVSDINATPITGSFFPVKQVLASAAQAAALSLPNPIARHYLLNRTDAHEPAEARVGHSFDLGSVGIAAPEDWDTADESPNQKARRLARDEVLRWLEFKLQPEPVPGLGSHPGDPGQMRVSWQSRARIFYELRSSENLLDWPLAEPGVEGDGSVLLHDFAPPLSGRRFFKLEYQPVPAPVGAPEHAGFFLSYDDLAL